jgi:hypothetical protein
MPLSPEWAKLPRRRCDDCGKMYKQVRPRREGEMGFCSDNCRKSYHKHGGAYRKLKVEMKRMVEKGIHEMRTDLWDIVRTEVEHAINRKDSGPHPPAPSPLQAIRS